MLKFLQSIVDPGAFYSNIQKTDDQMSLHESLNKGITEQSNETATLHDALHSANTSKCSEDSLTTEEPELSHGNISRCQSEDDSTDSCGSFSDRKSSGYVRDQSSRIAPPQHETSSINLDLPEETLSEDAFFYVHDECEANIPSESRTFIPKLKDTVDGYIKQNGHLETDSYIEQNVVYHLSQSDEYLSSF